MTLVNSNPRSINIRPGGLLNSIFLDSESSRSGQFHDRKTEISYIMLDHLRLLDHGPILPDCTLSATITPVESDDLIRVD